MRLTAGEYCQFNMQSRVQFLAEKGTFVLFKKINAADEFQLYSLDNFYVEVYIRKNEIINAEPIKQNNYWNFIVATIIII